MLATLAEGVPDPSALAARLIAAGHQLISMRESEVNLETAFLEITKGSLGRPKAVANPAPNPAPSA